MKPQSFEAFVRSVKKDDAYWTERAALEFSIDLARLLDRKAIKRTDLAKRLGTSPAYITKVFRGDVNFTIESMVRLVRALDGRIHIHVADSDHRVRWLDIADTREVPAVTYREFASGRTKVSKTARYDDQLPVAA